MLLLRVSGGGLVFAAQAERADLAAAGEKVERQGQAGAHKGEHGDLVRVVEPEGGEVDVLEHDLRYVLEEDYAEGHSWREQLHRPILGVRFHSHEGRPCHEDANRLQDEQQRPDDAKT